MVGANLVRALLDRGDEVRAADRRTTSGSGGPERRARPHRIQPQSLQAAFAGADTSFHLAAIISIIGDLMGIGSAAGPRNAARAAMGGVSWFVHSSSVHAFDLEPRAGPRLREQSENQR